MRLLGVEVRRVLARRMVLAVVLGGLAVVALVIAGQWSAAAPPSAAQMADAERMYQELLEFFEREGEEMVEQCRADEEAARERGELGPDDTYGCDDMEPRLEWFLPPTLTLRDSYEDVLAGVALLVTAVTFLIGATATAAELSTGSMSMWLTFVPRRMRVLFSKVGSAVVVGLPVAALLTAVVVGGLVAAYSLVGSFGDMTGEQWGDVAGIALRTVVIGGVAAAGGAALGVLLRHTAAVLGAVVGWAVVVEGILASQLQGLQAYTARVNLDAWVRDGTVYWRTECTPVDGQGMSCAGVEVPVSLAHASVWWLVVLVLVLGVTALVFRRRDVA